MSAHLFDWKHKASWLHDVDEYGSSVLTRRVRARIAKQKPECWSDDFNWLSDAYAEDEFSNCFAAHYSHVRAFHGCRPERVRDYFEEGILGQTSENIVQRFYNLYDDVPRTLLDQAVDEMSSRGDSERGRLWVVLTEEELLEDCGHYLIQGSEYLMALAATLCRLSSKEDFRLRLRHIGIPTIIEARVPIADLPEGQVSALSKLVLSAWGQKVSNRPLGVSHNPCLTIQKTVDKNYLVGHTHPRRIRDPHFGYIDYINEISTCAACAC